MRFYSKRHGFYVGIDLHARQLFVCVMDQEGMVVLHRNMPAEPKYLDQVLARFTGDVVVAVECIFSWYWIAEYCGGREIPFVLGHAPSMKAIYGTKGNNDRIDSQKIATMRRAGVLPQAYVYPRKMRATSDLQRPRKYFVHQQSALCTDVTNTNTQYNYPVFANRIRAKTNRKDLAERFVEPSTRKSVEADLHLLDVHPRILLAPEAEIKRQATEHAPVADQLLRTIPGVGPILGLVILYEIHDISRFPEVGNFISYARLVKCAHESASKRVGGGQQQDRERPSEVGLQRGSGAVLAEAR